MTGADALIEASASGLFWFIADRWTKSIVSRRLGTGEIGLGGGVRLRRVDHRRTASRWSEPMVLGSVWCISLVCAIVLRARFGWFNGQGALLGLGAAFGGAGGNLLDLLRRRPIIDFVDLRWWPAFNVADIGIVGGLLAALVAFR